MIKLVDVYAEIAEFRAGTRFLYRLLQERESVSNISHREMPTFEQHAAFVDSRPYQAWYIVFVDDEAVGATYLSKQNEIGIFILREHQGKHFGKMAVRQLMELHPEKQYLANIAPGNARSIAMFEKLGFGLIQLTFEKRE